MHSSTALTEYRIRRPALRDLNIESLPPELQDVVAELLCTIVDATAFKAERSLAELRNIASKLAPKTTRKDGYQQDRPLVTQLLERTKKAVNDGPDVPERTPVPHEPTPEAAPLTHQALEVRMLIDQLTTIDPAFASLDPAVVLPSLRERSMHKLAAILTVACGAFGEPTPSSALEKREAIDRVKRLSLRAKDA